MATPPPSEGLFLSSPPPSVSFDTLSKPCPGESQVKRLLLTARKQSKLDVVEELLGNDLSSFFACLKQKCNLIRQRSQDLEHHEVSIFDKVLLELSKGNIGLNNTVLINFFSTHYLGVDSNLKASEKVTAFRSGIFTLPERSNQEHPATLSPSLTRCSTSSGHSPKKPLFAKFSVASPFNVQEVPKSFIDSVEILNHAKLSRIYQVYTIAKKDYMSTLPSDSDKTLKEARFLRDTVENTLDTIKDAFYEDIHVDQEIISELEQTQDHVSAHILNLKDGVKRKFDAPADSQDCPRSVLVKRIKQARHRGATNGFHRGYATPNLIRDRALDGSSNTHGRRSETRSSSRDGNARFVRHHDRVPSSRPFNGPVRGQTWTAQAYLKPEEGEVTPLPKKRGEIGRGHSGIPFGYSRQVDSWVPGRG